MSRPGYVQLVALKMCRGRGAVTYRPGEPFEVHRTAADALCSDKRARRAEDVMQYETQALPPVETQTPPPLENDDDPDGPLVDDPEALEKAEKEAAEVDADMDGYRCMKCGKKYATDSYYYQKHVEECDDEED